jgi:UDP-N-acetylglucosamine--N-acetylmuramyl-(pentapeptide) pyrophosphoryl-undecaprenol N-acetylglucosamine transferase
LKSNLRLIFTGGGTAGHINPALTIANLFKEKGTEILFVGCKGGLEEVLVPKAGYNLAYIKSKPLPRKIGWELVANPLVTMSGFLQAVRVIRNFKPHAVVGTGGYVTVPAMLAACFLKVPTLIHEQNAVPGKANIMLSKYVKMVAVGYPQAAEKMRGKTNAVVTGNPIRPEILARSKAEGQRRLGLDPQRLTAVIFGGSLGARSINEAVFQARERLIKQEKVQIIHQTGASEFPRVAEAYKSLGIIPEGDVIRDHNITVVPYLYDMPSALAAGDLVVCRSGAVSVAEVTALGLPAIFIPYPHAHSDEQTHNARAVVETGGAFMIPDTHLNGEVLADKLLELINHHELRHTMSVKSKQMGYIDAADRIRQLIEDLIGLSHIASV